MQDQKSGVGSVDPQPGPSKVFRSIEIDFISEIDANEIMVLEAVLANPECQ